ncbi:MAG: RDD family protein [Pseudomonadota bacterium]
MTQTSPLEEVSPYQAPTAPMIEETSNELELAGRGTRLLAYLTDNFILIIPLILVIPFIFGQELEQSQYSKNAIENAIIGVIILWFIVIFIINAILLHRNGQTIGKRFFSIKIVRVNGNRAGLLRIIFLRYLPVSLLSSIPTLGGIIALLDALFIFRESRRCLHDMIADTIVINCDA